MDHLLLLLNTTLGLTAVLLFFHHLRRRSTSAQSKLAPEAGGAWPIIGHLPLLAGDELPHVTLGGLADKYGPIFTIRVGVRQALVVSSWEMAKEVFTINDLAASNRPKLTAVKHMGYNFVMFGFGPYSKYWREMRKIVTSELLSNRQLGLLKHVRVSEVETSLKQLHKLWAEKKNGSGHVLVDFKRWFGDISLNVILRMVAGKRYCGTGVVAEEKETRQCQEAIGEFFHLLGLFVVRDAIPFLGWLDVKGHEKAMKRTSKILDNIVGKWLEEHRTARSGSGEEVADKEEDFMDTMLSILQDTEFEGIDSDIVNKSTCLNIIAGSSDTIAVTLVWIVSVLLNNGHTLKKAQEELDKHVGKERQVNESDISKLIYMQAIVKEALRLYPPAPLLPREFMEDCIINGYHIRKGTRLITNIWKIQRDPRIWPNPLEFDPERFLTSHKEVDVKGQNFELIPFGSGRRVCPGASFALQMVHLTLASFLHAFELSTPSSAPIDMSERPGLTNMKSTPLEVLVSPRLPSKLYV